MKTFALLFRMDITTPEKQPTPDQMNAYMEQWTGWINELTKKELLVDGNHFSSQGRLLKPGNNMENTPYISEHNSVAGYLLIAAQHMDEATKVAKKCPILFGENTSVEIREIAEM
jgi:hypothetical protein